MTFTHSPFGVAPRPSTGGFVLVVEDDLCVAQVLVETVSDLGYQVQHAATAVAALPLVERQPDLVILDLVLPDADGLVLCVHLASVLRAPILVCSASQRTRDRALALAVGADDFLAKPFAIAELEARVQALLRGAPRETDVAAQVSPVAAAQPAGASEALVPGAASLTRREREILALIARGHRNAQISQELHIGIYTVESHVAHILRKLHAQSRTEAVRRATEWHLLDGGVRLPEPAPKNH